MISYGRVFEIWTLCIESGLGVPSAMFPPPREVNAPEGRRRELEVICNNQVETIFPLGKDDAPTPMFHTMNFGRQIKSWRQIEREWMQKSYTK
jgi:hypothetical protein